MAMYQTPDRACVEFLKSSGSLGKGRFVRLVGPPEGQIPQQLYGQLDPQTWNQFMAEVRGLADRHPYLVSPGGGQCAEWLACGAIGSVLGICCINPDSGDYPAWFQEVEGFVSRWQPFFQQQGLHLSFHHTRMRFGLFWKPL